MAGKVPIKQAERRTHHRNAYKTAEKRITAETILHDNNTEEEMIKMLEFEGST